MEQLMVNGFFGEYRFLSNFWYCSVKLDGITYPSTEHAFQAAKTLDAIERNSILNTKTPGIAKKIGRLVTLRNDWEFVKDSIMYDLLQQKFRARGLRALLLATSPKELVEYNNWNDQYWGRTDAGGLNKLGQLLMKVREEVTNEY